MENVLKLYSLELDESAMKNTPEACPPTGSHPVVPNDFLEDYLSKTPLKDISAFFIAQQCGENHIVFGETARALFKDGLPEVDTGALSTKAKLFLGEDLQFQTEPVCPGEINGFRLSEKMGSLGLYRQFVSEFSQLKLTIQGRELGGGENLDRDLQAFVQLVGGEQKARIISRLMHWGLADMAQILFGTDEKISTVLRGSELCVSGFECEGSSRSICLNKDGSVTLNLRLNGLGNNGIYECLESQVSITGFNRSPQIDEAKVLVIFVSSG